MLPFSQRRRRRRSSARDQSLNNSEQPAQSHPDPSTQESQESQESLGSSELYYVYDPTTSVFERTSHIGPRFSHALLREDATPQTDGGSSQQGLSILRSLSSLTSAQTTSTEHAGDSDTEPSKRRKVEQAHDMPLRSLRPYGIYGQVDAGLLDMEIVNITELSNRVEVAGILKPENILSDDDSVYFMSDPCRTILLRHKGDAPFTIEDIVIQTPKRESHYPVQEGLIFVGMDPSALWQGSQRYNLRLNDVSQSDESTRLRYASPDVEFENWVQSRELVGALIDGDPLHPVVRPQTSLPTPPSPTPSSNSSRTARPSSPDEARPPPFSQPDSATTATTITPIAAATSTTTSRRPIPPSNIALAINDLLSGSTSLHLIQSGESESDSDIDIDGEPGHDDNMGDILDDSMGDYYSISESSMTEDDLRDPPGGGRVNPGPFDTTRPPPALRRHPSTGSYASSDWSNHSNPYNLPTGLPLPHPIEVIIKCEDTDTMTNAERDLAGLESGRQFNRIPHFSTETDDEEEYDDDEMYDDEEADAEVTDEEWGGGANEWSDALNSAFSAHRLLQRSTGMLFATAQKVCVRSTLEIKAPEGALGTVAPPPPLTAPHAMFFIPRRKNRATIRFNPPITAKYILIKLFSPSVKGMMTVQRIAVRGRAGPQFFPSASIR